MTEKINTTISATDTFFDLDGNIVPSGIIISKLKK